MDDPTPGDLDALAADPDELDGHTIDELADYVDRGRSPADPSIESSPSCRRAIAALERLRSVSAGLLADDPGRPLADDRWVDAVMARIAVDARAGADFPLLVTADGDEVVMTEGALRALVRAAGDEQPGFLVGRVRFDGDLAAPDELLVVRVDLVVAYGVAVPEGTARLRAAVLERVRRHTSFHVLRIDIDVRDLTVDGGSA